MVGLINASYAYTSGSTALLLIGGGIATSALVFLEPFRDLAMLAGFDTAYSMLAVIGLYPLTVSSTAALGWRLRVWHGFTDGLLEMGRERMQEARARERDDRRSD